MTHQCMICVCEGAPCSCYNCKLLSFFATLPLIVYLHSCYGTNSQITHLFQKNFLIILLLLKYTFSRLRCLFIMFNRREINICPGTSIPVQQSCWCSVALSEWLGFSLVVTAAAQMKDHKTSLSLLPALTFNCQSQCYNLKKILTAVLLHSNRDEWTLHTWFWLVLLLHFHCSTLRKPSKITVRHCDVSYCVQLSWWTLNLISL